MGASRVNAQAHAHYSSLRCEGDKNNDLGSFRGNACHKEQNRTMLEQAQAMRHFVFGKLTAQPLLRPRRELDPQPRTFDFLVPSSSLTEVFHFVPKYYPLTQDVTLTGARKATILLLLVKTLQP